LHHAFVDAEQRARVLLADDGVPASLVHFNRMADMRYVGQEYTVRIAFPDNRYDDDALTRMPDLFHRAHHTRYGHSNPAEAVEFVNVRVSAIGRIEKPPLEITRNGHANGHLPPAPATRRAVIFDGQAIDTAVYRRADLYTGQTFPGPAIVEEASCTTVISPRFRAEVDALGNLVIHRVRERSA
jgi:N-methylhydantoinase A